MWLPKPCVEYVMWGATTSIVLLVKNWTLQSVGEQIYPVQNTKRRRGVRVSYSVILALELLNCTQFLGTVLEALHILIKPAFQHHCWLLTSKKYNLQPLVFPGFPPVCWVVLIPVSESFPILSPCISRMTFHIIPLMLVLPN